MDNPQRSLENRLHWLGGIFDGEGSFSLIALRRKGKLYSFRPQASVVNTDDRIIDEVISILEELELPFHVHRHTARKYSQRPVSEVRIIGLKRVARALPSIIPYLVSKKARAQAILDFAELRLLQENIKHGQPLTDFEISLVEFVRKENDAKNGRSKPLNDYTPETRYNRVMI